MGTNAGRGHGANGWSGWNATRTADDRRATSAGVRRGRADAAGSARPAPAGRLAGATAHVQPRRRGEAARRAPDEDHRDRAAAVRGRWSTCWPSGREHSGAGAWAGYVAAAAEAGMVGALADWFAVTALFRHPLGLPIPHTAIIPTKKDQLGAVASASSSARTSSPPTSYGSRLRAVGIGSRLGAWLAEPEHADRVTAELSTALRGALTVLRDSDVQAVVGEAITRRADAQEIAPGIGQDAGEGRRGRRPPAGRRPGLRPRPRLAGRARRLGHGRGRRAARPAGPRGSSTSRVGERVYKELLRFVTEMRDMPDHPARGAVDRFLDRLRRRPPVRHGDPRAGGAAQERGAGPRRGPGPDRLRLDAPYAR